MTSNVQTFWLSRHWNLNFTSTLCMTKGLTGHNSANSPDKCCDGSRWWRVWTQAPDSIYTPSALPPSPKTPVHQEHKVDTFISIFILIIHCLSDYPTSKACVVTETWKKGWYECVSHSRKSRLLFCQNESRIEPSPYFTDDWPGRIWFITTTEGYLKIKSVVSSKQFTAGTWPYTGSDKKPFS